MGKRVTLLLLVTLTASSLLMVEVAPASAQSKPSVPEFSLKFVDASYDVPTTYTIDPYTGQNVTHQGYHVDRAALVMVIQNQPLVYQYNGHGSFGSVNFYYNVQVKGHYEENWTPFYSNDDLPIANTSSTQTSLTLGFLGEGGLFMDSRSEEEVPFGGEEDFQVQAMIGYFHKMAVPLSGWFFEGESSGWSETQTLAIEEIQTPTPSPEPTLSPEPTTTPYNEPQITDQELITGIAIAVAVIGAGLGLLIYLIKRK